MKNSSRIFFPIMCLGGIALALAFGLMVGWVFGEYATVLFNATDQNRNVIAVFGALIATILASLALGWWVCEWGDRWTPKK